MVLVNAADPTAIEPAMVRLKAAGITSVALDVTAKGADAQVQTNNIAAGRNACKYISDKLERQWQRRHHHRPAGVVGVDRVSGCKQVLSKSPGIKILSDNQNGKVSREGGLEVMIGLLTAFDKSMRCSHH